jgi:hypothetical protein
MVQFPKNPNACMHAKPTNQKKKKKKTAVPSPRVVRKRMQKRKEKIRRITKPCNHSQTQNKTTPEK